MADVSRLSYLRIALIGIGLVFIFGIYPLSIVWPSGWTWGAWALPLSHDDHGPLCDAGSLLDPCIAQPLRTPESHLVHRVVQHSAWSNYGASIDQ